jgi:cyclopropane-fatty-acyl-phospholipid synthase
VTLSEQQYHYAKERVRQEGLEDQVEIRLQDYRELEGEFDRISSVGMFEHVGLVNLPEYFSKIAELLTPDGWAMNHGITSMSTSQGEDPIAGSDFIDKYVFPNGELPHISLVLQIMQESGLEAFDVESLRRHYARTLSLWTEHYEAQSEAVRALVDEKTYRIWRVYLPGCAYAFDIGNVGIYQIVCSKAGRLSEQLPWTREFIYEQKK